MRILYIIPEEYQGERWGGVTTYTVELAQEFCRKNYSITIVTPSRQNSYSRKKGISFYTIALPKATTVIQKILVHLGYLLFSDVVERVRWASTVRTFVNTHGPFDIIEAPEWGSSTLFLSFFRTKTVVRLHKSWLMYRKDNEFPITLSNRLVDILERFCILTASLVTSPTRFMLRQYPLLMFIRSALRKPAYCVPNGILRSKRSRKVIAKKYGKYILAVGRIEAGKGSLDLMNAFLRIAGKYPTLNLIFVGEDTQMYIHGSYKSCVKVMKEKLIKNHLNQRVFFVPRQNRSALWSYYASCFFYCAPSRGYENFPLSLVEATNNGKASVMSSAGGLPEIFDLTRAGIVFKNGDSQDLVKKMQRLLDDSAFRHQCEKNALRYSTVFDIRLVASKMLSAYQRVR